VCQEQLSRPRCSPTPGSREPSSTGSPTKRTSSTPAPSPGGSVTDSNANEPNNHDPPPRSRARGYRRDGRGMLSAGRSGNINTNNHRREVRARSGRGRASASHRSPFAALLSAATSPAPGGRWVRGVATRVVMMAFPTAELRSRMERPIHPWSLHGEVRSGGQVRRLARGRRVDQSRATWGRPAEEGTRIWSTGDN
jgi:hypothetical protein